MKNLAGSSDIHYFRPLPVDGINSISVRSPYGSILAFCSNDAAPYIKVCGQISSTYEVNTICKIENGELSVNILFLGDCFDSDYIIEIALPMRLLEKISVFTSSSNIIFNGILAKHIFCRTQNGNIDIHDSLFGSLNFVTLNGNITFEGSLIADSTVDITSLAGSVFCSIDNVSQADICINASTYKCAKQKGGYHSKIIVYTQRSEKVAVLVNNIIVS